MTAPNSLAGAVFETEVRVKRAQLLQHLRRLYCGVPEVVLSGPLRAEGMAPNGVVLVITAGLSDVEPLPTEIGVALKPIIGTLSCLEGDDIELRLEAHHLVLASGSRRIRIPTMLPQDSHTQVDPALLARLMARLPDDEWQEFNADLAKGVVQAIRGLGAEQVIVRVGPGGSTIVVGDPAFQSVEFDVPDVCADTPYGIFVPAGHLQSVFAEVGESRPAICLAGANGGIVGLRLQSADGDVEVTYLISLLENTGGSSGRIPKAEPPEQEPPPTNLREMDPPPDVVA